MNTSLRTRCLGLAALVSASAFAAAQVGPGQGNPPPPGPPPVRFETARLGDMVRVPGEGPNDGPIMYRVVSVTSGLRDYKQHYNQAGRKLHPGFSNDRLAVIELEVTNQTGHPIAPPVFMAAITDSDGAHGTEWFMDARQEAYVRERRSDAFMESNRPAEIGAAGTMKLALVFSVSAKAKPTVLEFSPHNFRDMPFGRLGFRPGSAVAPPARTLGPREGRPNMPPREAIRIRIDLTSRK